MYVSVIHTIKDPASFQTRGQQLTQQPPARVRPLQFLPDDRGMRATCVWAGDSVDEVRDHIDGILADASDQEYFVVAEQNAMGLPATQLA